MVKIQMFSDKLAICLSSICLIHCLLIPMVLVLIPTAGVFLEMEHDTLHEVLLYLVVPLGVFALTLGFTHHKNTSVLAIGLIGLGLLALTVMLGHERLSESAELTLTTLASCMIALAHYKNFKLRNAHHCALLNNDKD